MNAPAAKMTVYASGRFACVKIAGRANFNVSLDFKTLLTGLHRKGFDRFVLDLTDCVLMDSTFLGVLTGFGITMNQGNGNGDPHPVELLRPNARIVELLENLGVLQLFSICQGVAAVPDGAQHEPQEPGNASREQITRTCLEAHETLMALSPENAARFKEVAKFLSEDLKKLEKR